MIDPSGLSVIEALAPHVSRYDEATRCVPEIQAWVEMWLPRWKSARR